MVLLVIQLNNALPKIPLGCCSCLPIALNKPMSLIMRRSRLRWLDVLVPPEEVRRIVLLLECSQPLVVGPICGPNPTLALVAEIIHIDALLQERLQGGVAGAPPRDVRLRCRRLTPCPENEATVLCASVAEGGVPLADPADRPAQVFDRYRRERRGNIGCEEVDQRLDRVVTEGAEEPTLPVMAKARREDLRQQVLDAGVWRGSNRVDGRRTELPQGP